ncbi:MAG: hypothetical protein M3299_00945 [Thermoproteota archaeon]|nr:hypothetical protein [Thermoproteota archaeon]
MKYYQKLLNDLANIKEGEEISHEADQFGYYLVSTAQEAGAATKELEKEPQDVTVLVKEEDYGSIVKQALAHYIADLSRRQDITLGGELTEGIKRVSSPYESEISAAENLRQFIEEQEETTP